MYRLPGLPLELQIQLLRYLGREPRFPQVTKALASCCLVCHAWSSICQIYLLESVRLASGEQMRHVVLAMSYTTKPIGSYVKRLRIDSSTNDGPFHHLVPYYMARRLPYLTGLSIFGATTNTDLFPIPKQFTMYLSHFRCLSSLFLCRYHFQTFWDLRRFVVTLPMLLDLTLIGVTWPQFSDDLQMTPSLPSSARRLQRVNCGTRSASREVLWLWATSVKPSGLGHPAAHSMDILPAFTIRDVVAIGRYIGQISESSNGRIDLKYSR